MSRQSDRKRVVRPLIHALILGGALIAGWPSVAAAAPSAAAADPAPAIGRAADPTPPAGPAHPITAWVAGGLGTAGIWSQGGDAARVELALATGFHLFSLRYVFAIDTNGGCGLSACTGSVSLPHDTVKELALQYGVKKRIPYLLATASAGVSMLWASERGNTLLETLCFGTCQSTYDRIDSHTIGATAELGVYLTSQHVSVGPTVVVDVNSVQPFWSLFLDLHFGWMGDGGVFRGRQSP